MTFSIVIPVYNAALHLEACLRSVMDAAQEVKKIGEGEEWRVEIICVDDGSTDGSGEILEDFEVKARCGGSRKGLIFKVVHQQNQGVSAARNAGLAAATGAWIAFVDADDVVSSTYLTEILSGIRQCPKADLVRFLMARFDETSEPIWNSTCQSWQETDLSHSLASQSPLRSFVCYAYRRELVQSLRFKTYAVGEDRLFLWEALARARCAVETDVELYAYRLHGKSVMHSGVTPRKLADRLDYALVWLALFRSCGKRLSHETMHVVGTELTENYVAQIEGVSLSDRKALWDGWWQMVRRFSRAQKRLVTPWFAFAISCCQLLPINLVARILFGVPYRLKKKGVHR